MAEVFVSGLVRMEQRHRSSAMDFVRVCQELGWRALQQSVLEQLGAAEQAESAAACGCRDWPTTGIPIAQLWPRDQAGLPTGHHPGCALYREPRLPVKADAPPEPRPMLEANQVKLQGLLDTLGNFARLKTEQVRQVLGEVALETGADMFELADRAAVFPSFESAVYVPGRGSVHPSLNALRLALRAVASSMASKTTESVTLEPAELEQPTAPEEVTKVEGPADGPLMGPAYATLHVNLRPSGEDLAWGECHEDFWPERVILHSAKCGQCPATPHALDLIVGQTNLSLNEPTGVLVPSINGVRAGELLLFRVDNLESHAVEVELLIVGRCLGSHVHAKLVSLPRVEVIPQPTVERAPEPAPEPAP